MTTRSLSQLWEQINKAGGIDPYIDQQLQAQGFLVQRQDTTSMNKKELQEYKQSLKKEAIEKRELKKKAWQAYKENHILHLGEGVYWNDAADWDQWDLPNAEKRAAENELPQLDKAEHLAKALDLSLPELRWFTYHRDAAEKIHYHCFQIPKRDGSLRAIWAPLPKLKGIQQWILQEILEHIPVHGAAHGFLPGRSIYTNADVHVNSKTVLRMDLKDFFPTITVRRVKGIFRKAGYREQIATLLSQLCTEAPREIVKQKGKTYYAALGPRCLPQGAPTSPALTNIICMKLDRRLAGLAKKLGWRYTRYADDLTFSLPNGHKGKPQLGLLLGSIQRVVEDEGFQIHKKKTWVAREGDRHQITGLVVNGEGTPRIPRKLKRTIRAAIHNAQQGKGFKDGEGLNQMIGYAAYTYMAEPELGAKFLKALHQLQKEQKIGSSPED